VSCGRKPRYTRWFSERFFMPLPTARVATARPRSHRALVAPLWGLVALPLFVAALAGCGGGGDNGSVTPPVPSPSPVASPSPSASPRPTRTGLFTGTFASSDGASLSRAPLSATTVVTATLTAKPIPNPNPSAPVRNVVTLAGSWTDGNAQTSPAGTLIRRISVSFSDLDAIPLGKVYTIGQVTPNVPAFPSAVNYTENVVGTTVGQKAYEGSAGSVAITAINGDTYTIALRNVKLRAEGYQATGTATVNGDGRLDQITRQ